MLAHFVIRRLLQKLSTQMPTSSFVNFLWVFVEKRKIYYESITSFEKTLLALSETITWANNQWHFCNRRPIVYFSWKRRTLKLDRIPAQPPPILHYFAIYTISLQFKWVCLEIIILWRLNIMMLQLVISFPKIPSGSCNNMRLPFLNVRLVNELILETF